MGMGVPMSHQGGEPLLELDKRERGHLTTSPVRGSSSPPKCLLGRRNFSEGWSRQCF